jgi:hypothetical protein
VFLPRAIAHAYSAQVPKSKDVISPFGLMWRTVLRLTTVPPPWLLI